MPTRKAPQPEEARKLFLLHPNRTLQQWADLWGTSAERVRQIRHEAGVGAVFKLDMKVVQKVADRISLGVYTLANRELYKDFTGTDGEFAEFLNKKKIIPGVPGSEVGIKGGGFNAKTIYGRRKHF